MPSFRQPGSTERALALLQQAKYERQERRRAMVLLGALFGLAVMMHMSSRVNSYMLLPPTEMADSSWNFRNGGGGVKNAQNNIEIEVRTAEGAGPQEIVVEEEEEEEDPYMAAFRNMADFNSDWRETDTPFFWHIPRCAGSTVKDIMGQCMRLTSASEVGTRDGHDHDPTLQVIDYKGGKYVNVDTTSIPGIERAKAMGLAQSGIANVVVSSYLHESSGIFDPDHRGRAFLMLRNPIERAVSMYHYIREQRPELSDLSLQDFARGQGIENNWMVRFLVNQMEGELDKSKLEVAKEVLKRKFLIGFVDEKEESVKRFQKFTGWDTKLEEAGKLDDAQDCISNLLSTGVNVSPPYELPKKGSMEWALIMHQTQYDLKLYDFALELFDEQTKKYGSKEWKKAEKTKKKGGK